MKTIARQVNASETAFIFPSKKADFKIRWFTPNTEVGLCVHASLASLAVLKKERHVKKSDLSLETKNGLLKASLGKKIFISVSGYQRQSQKIKIALLKKYLKINNGDLDDQPRIIKIFQDKELLVPVKKLSKLKNLKPNQKNYAALCRALRVTGISIFTQQTFNKSNTLHTREFAPLYGYLEDPLCGLAAGAIAFYLQKPSLRIEQGNFLNLPGVIEVVSKSKTTYFIGGQTKIFKTLTL